MSGRARGSGVGRGNGAGSERTQFKEGAPSPNPKGRPRKNKFATPDVDLPGAMRRALGERVEVHENGVKRRMSHVDMMAKVLLARFPKASTREQILIFDLLTKGVAPISDQQVREIPAQSIAEFVAGLAEEAKKAEEADRSHARLFDMSRPN